MKKMVLTIISVLILILSTVLVYHILTDETVELNQTTDGEYDTLTDISVEIDEVLLDEYEEIKIGEMI